MEAKIKILDSVHCKANTEARELIKPLLKYKSNFFKRGMFGQGEVKEQVSHLITGRQGTGGTFLTGFIQRIKKYHRKEIAFSGYENIEDFLNIKEAKLKGIIFRPDQNKVFKKVKKHNRGIIHFPTGTGKTLIAAGIISMYFPCRVLFLCHTKDLILQSQEEFQRFFNNKKIFLWGDGHKPNWNKIKNRESCIVISTIQTFSKIEIALYSAFFDMTIVDEAHRANSLTSQYGLFMLNNLSPRKYGLTATLPVKEKDRLINEGFFGKVIASLTLQKGIEKKILSKPIINLISISFQVDIKNKAKNKYNDMYLYGIVKNKKRNEIIIQQAIKKANENESTLIVIEKTEHGLILEKMFNCLNQKCFFVYGNIESHIRSKIKERLKVKKIKIVICSRVWKEGINIPSLNNIIFACGLKGELATLQTLGRGLRSTEEKNKILFTDFLDPYPFLAEHSIYRLQTYKKYGWI